MPDFKHRHEFKKPDRDTKAYLDMVRSIKKEWDEEISTLCWSKDLQKRIDAYRAIKSIKGQYMGRLKGLYPEKRKELQKLLSEEEIRMDQALKSVPARIYFEIGGVHIPIVNSETGAPFSLYEFFDSPYLSDKKASFHAHFSEIDKQMVEEYFPGMEKVCEEKQSMHPYQHLSIKTAHVAYDVFYKGRKGWDVEAIGDFNHLRKHMHFEIPELTKNLPGDIDDKFKQFIERIKDDKSR
jgi:hypothetical protein